MKNIKLTKKDLKKNEFADFLKKVYTYIISKKERLQVVLISLIIILIAVPVIYKIIKSKMEKAVDIYSSTLFTYTRRISSPDSNYKDVINSMETVRKTYKKMKIAQLALFNIGDAYFRMNDYDNAILYYDKFLLESKDKNFVPYAHLSKGMAYLQKNEIAAAQKSFKRVISDYPGSYVIPESKIYLSICFLKLNNQKQAVEILESLKNEKQYEQWKNYAAYLITLYRQYDFIKKVDYTIPSGKLPAEEIFSDTGVTGSENNFSGDTEDSKQ